MKPNLQKLILVFFDIIFIYKKLEDHLQHIEKVFQLLQGHQLFFKISKYVFGSTKVEYLGNVVSHEGV